MRLNVAVPEAQVNPGVLNAALEAVTRLDESLLKEGAVPTAKEGIKKGVRWAPEPYDEEHFDHAGLVMRRGEGDCDDLAPWHAASLRHTGEDPKARAIVRRSGPNRWHALVQRSDGSIDDPSKWAGMGQHHSVRGASLALMYPAPSSVSGLYEVRPALAVRPNMGAWQARVDLPWHNIVQRRRVPSDYALASTVQHRNPHRALVRAIEGACRIGLAAGVHHPDHINRLCAIADYVDGVDPEQIAAVYGDEHAQAAGVLVGSLFGKIKNVAAKAARAATGPLARTALSFVPGGGAALSAYDMARSAYNVAKSVKIDPKAFADFGVNPLHVDEFVRAGFPVQ